MPTPLSVFKSYDIRGLSPGEIDVDFANALGRAAVEWSQAKIVVVGWDMRATSWELRESLIAGLVAQGAEVVEVGLVTTPLFYFATATLKADLGVMVTASHNPAKYNGFKLCRAGAVPVGSGSGMEEIRDRVAAGQFSDVTAGSRRTADVLAAYIDMVMGLVPGAERGAGEVVIDAGNGMAGHVLPQLTARLPFTVVPMYYELDGTFPNHEANPLNVDTLVALQKAVVERGAVCGLAYDGDADRIGVVDEKGEPIPADILAALLAPRLLARHPGAPVLFDVRCSRVVREEIERAGGVPVMSRVGHAHIKRQLREVGGCFAGELSGHFYFQDFFGVECSDAVLLHVLAMLTETGQPLSALIQPLKKYAQSGEINFTVHNPARVIAAVRDTFSQGALQVSELDGLRIEHATWWVSVRASNTEPVLRLNVEGDTAAVMVEQRDVVAACIQSHAQEA